MWEKSEAGYNVRRWKASENSSNKIKDMWVGETTITVEFLTRELTELASQLLQVEETLWLRCIDIPYRKHPYIYPPNEADMDVEGKLKLLCQLEPSVQDIMQEILLSPKIVSVERIKMLPVHEAIERVLSVSEFHKHAYALFHHYKQLMQLSQVAQPNIPTWAQLYTLASQLKDSRGNLNAQAQDYCVDILAMMSKTPTSESKPEEIKAFRDNVKLRMQHAWQGSCDIPTLNFLFCLLSNDSNITDEDEMIDFKKCELKFAFHMADKLYAVNNKVQSLGELLLKKNQEIKDLKQALPEEQNKKRKPSNTFWTPELDSQSGSSVDVEMKTPEMP